MKRTRDKFEQLSKRHEQLKLSLLEAEAIAARLRYEVEIAALELSQCGLIGRIMSMTRITTNKEKRK